MLCHFPARHKLSGLSPGLGLAKREFCGPGGVGIETDGFCGTAVIHGSGPDQVSKGIPAGVVEFLPERPMP